MPPVPTGDNEGTEPFEVAGVSPGYVNIHKLGPEVQFSNHDSNAKDRKDNKHFIPDMMTDE
jgi:hypothetical protein